MEVEAALSQLRGKEVALLGLGVENLALARFFLARDLPFSVCDLGAGRFDRQMEDWGDGVVEWSLGSGYLDDLQRFDVLFRTPGISPLRSELTGAGGKGTRVSSQTQLFFEVCSAPILAVTGTKGKGTTVSLIAEMLRSGPYRRTVTGGNIGTPPIAVADELGAEDIAILELSSFQLQDLERSPAVAVVLAVTEDHQDYHADMAEYVAAKANIARYQSSEDWVVFDGACAHSQDIATQSAARSLATGVSGPLPAGAWVEAERIWRRLDGGAADQVCSVDSVRLRGRHNLANVTAAVAAATAAAARIDCPMETNQLADGIADFAGLPHRLEIVGTHADVTFVDDSLGTTPAAASAAVRAFDEPVVLIAGGASKGADFAEMAAAVIGEGVRGVVLIGEEAGRIEAALEQAGGFTGETVKGCQTMAAAVTAARRLSRPGDVVILSPGCSSFDMFANYKDRAEQFRAQIVSQA